MKMTTLKLEVDDCRSFTSQLMFDMLFSHYGRLKLDFARPCCLQVLTCLLRWRTNFFKDIRYSSMKKTVAASLFRLLSCAQRPVAVTVRHWLEKTQNRHNTQRRVTVKMRDRLSSESSGTQVKNNYAYLEG